MYQKKWSLGFIVAAIVVGALFLFWPKEKMAELLIIPRFLESALPVLAVGALVKYLLSHTK